MNTKPNEEQKVLQIKMPLSLFDDLQIRASAEAQRPSTFARSLIAKSLAQLKKREMRTVN